MAENFCKYYKLIKQVSYNNGQTWSNVDPQEYEKGDLYEEHSTDCGSTVIYRWVDIDGEYTCVGTTKYQKTKKEVSYDGITWEDVSPPEYGTSSVIEYRSTDCGYVPQEGIKFKAAYSNGTLYTLQCNYEEELTYEEIREFTTPFSAMTSAEIGNSENNCVKTICRDAFYGCIGLTSVTIHNGVEKIEQSAFENCLNLKSISIPSSVTSISIGCQDASVGCVGCHAFFWCQSLESISVDSNNTVYDSRGGCNAIIKTNTNKLLIGCKNTVIPNTVTSIMGGAFWATASGLTSIVIPSSVTEIGAQAFYECPLESVTVQATTPPTIGTSVFSGSGSYPIYVPAASVNTYKAAEGWRQYVYRIFGY